MKNIGAGVKRILVVEDEPAICEICSRVLPPEGFEVDIAASGRVAQGMIEQKDYDIYLFDILTPEMNGQELYQWLLEEYPQLAERVIFTTGSMMGGETLDFIKKSGRLFLPKPFTHEELINIIRKAVK